MKSFAKYIKEYSKSAYKKLTREPSEILKYPFIVPGANYSNELWDWDSWLTDIAIRQIMLDCGEEPKGFIEYEKGCVLNFLDFKVENNKMPIMISSRTGDSLLRSSKNAHKPCLLQHIAFIIKHGGGLEWIADRYSDLKNFILFYKTQAYHEPTGLYFWCDDIAIGIDNDPSIFYRPDGSTASVYLNCLMYRELLAFAYVSRALGYARDGEKFEAEAESLKACINEHLYDEKCGMYFSADINLNPIDPNAVLHSGMPRHWHCLIQRIDSWAGFMALWSGVATEERAKRVVYENMLCERTFMSNFGIRSLSRLEKMYCIVKSGNPSCWLGPVWGIANYMCFKGLLKYGFEKEALELGEKTVRLFGEDIMRCGEMHEYYDPESGEGVNGPGFQSWNLLVNNMIAILEGREFVEEF